MQSTFQEWVIRSYLFEGIVIDYWELFCIGDRSILPIFNNASLYLAHGCRFYALGYNLILLYFVAQTVPTSAAGSHFRCLMSFCKPSSLWGVSKYFLTFWHQKIHQASSCISPTPVLESFVSLRNPGSFYLRMVLEIKIWVLGMLIDTRVSLLLDSLSWQSKRIYVCILTHVCMPIIEYLYKYLYIYIHLYL